MSGSSTSSSAGSYGILHQESSSNLPMARNSHVMEYHAPSNCLVLFGGNSASGLFIQSKRKTHLLCRFTYGYMAL